MCSIKSLWLFWLCFICKVKTIKIAVVTSLTFGNVPLELGVMVSRVRLRFRSSWIPFHQT